MNFNNEQSVEVITNGFIRENGTKHSIYSDITNLIEKYLRLPDFWDGKLSDKALAINRKLNIIERKSNSDTNSHAFACGMQVLSFAKYCNYKHWKLCILPNTSSNNTIGGISNANIKTIVGLISSEMLNTLQTTKKLKRFLTVFDKCNGFAFFNNAIYFANYRRAKYENYFQQSVQMKYGMIIEMIFDMRDANADNNQALLKFIVNGIHGEFISIDLQIDEVKEYRMIVSLDSKTDIVQILQ